MRLPTRRPFAALTVPNISKRESAPTHSYTPTLECITVSPTTLARRFRRGRRHVPWAARTRKLQSWAHGRKLSLSGFLSMCQQITTTDAAIVRHRYVKGWAPKRNILRIRDTEFDAKVYVFHLVSVTIDTTFNVYFNVSVFSFLSTNQPRPLYDHAGVCIM